MAITTLIPNQFTQTATETLQINLLGTPQVLWAGQAYVIPRRQTRALLYYLAAHEEPIPRQQLCYLLWPDLPELIARRNLSRLSAHLRRALPNPDLVVTKNDQVNLNSNLFMSDLSVFQECCAAHAVHNRIHFLKQAVALYRGQFLSGISMSDLPEFEGWITQKQSRLEHCYLEALMSLIESHTKMQAYDQAIDYAKRYLDTDNLAESVHCLLVELYAMIGDRAAAARQFEQCTVILEREFGISPLPETRAVYQSVLRTNGVVDQPTIQHKTILKPELPSAWSTLPSLDAPFVGRAVAFDQLEQALNSVQTGRNNVVLISGESGIGKSRLIQDFAKKFEAEATIVIMSGHQAEKGLPLWPIIEAIRNQLPAIDWTRLDIDPVYLTEMLRLLPEIHMYQPDLPAPPSIKFGYERGQLFQALTCWFVQLAAQAPSLILCLDDLQWIDPDTLCWLSYLVRQLVRVPLLIIGTYQTQDAASIALLRTEFIRLGVLREIELTELSQVEALQLIQQLVGNTEATKIFGQQLYEEIGGNPFILLEILRAMCKANLQPQRKDGRYHVFENIRLECSELPIPETVDNIIQVRLSHISHQAFQILEASSVIGARFTFNQIWSASGRSQDEVLDALDTLLASQILVEKEDQYAFIHPFVRTVVYRSLSNGRRRLLQRRVNRAI